MTMTNEQATIILSEVAEEMANSFNEVAFSKVAEELLDATYRAIQALTEIDQLKAERDAVVAELKELKIQLLYKYIDATESHRDMVKDIRKAIYEDNPELIKLGWTLGINDDIRYDALKKAKLLLADLQADNGED